MAVLPLGWGNPVQVPNCLTQLTALEGQRGPSAQKKRNCANSIFVELSTARNQVSSQDTSMQRLARRSHCGTTIALTVLLQFNAISVNFFPGPWTPLLAHLCNACKFVTTSSTSMGASPVTKPVGSAQVFYNVSCYGNDCFGNDWAK